MRNERMHPCRQPPLCRNLGILFCLKHGVQLDGWSFLFFVILTQSWATFTGIVKSIKFDECLTLVKYWCAYWKERIALIWGAFNSKTLAWKSLKKWAIPRNGIGRNRVLENGGTLALINRNIKQLFLRFCCIPSLTWATASDKSCLRVLMDGRRPTLTLQGNWRSSQKKSALIFTGWMRSI